MKRSSIEVSVRVRPSRPEVGEPPASPSTSAWSLSSSTLQEISNPHSVFTFDHVYTPGTTTQELYEQCVQANIVARVTQGYNGTVLAYGQTGSGKTYTMFGDGIRGRVAGVATLAVRDLFTALEAECQQQQQQHTVHTLSTEVHVSVLEIYNEQLRDLLANSSSLSPASLSAGVPGTAPSNGKPLSIRENDHGVYVHNATRMRVRSAAECLHILYACAESRVSAATAMNEQSSRSHCIMRVEVEKVATLVAVGGETEDEITEEEEEGNTGDDESDGISGKKANAHSSRHAADSRTYQRRYVATLNLVDLAGSERVAKSGATGQRMVEGGHINKSLTILSTVISRLTEEPGRADGGGDGVTASPTATRHVPYRDCRLTHLLKTAIGGNSFTAVVCCISPAPSSLGESRSTLQFASRVKHIHNKVSVNELADPRARLRIAQGELRRVKRLLVAQTIYLWSKKVQVQRLQGLLGQEVGGDSLHPVASPSLQQQAIIQQLTAQNAQLREEVEKLCASGGGEHGDGDGALAAAHSECAALRTSMEELDGLCHELEAESAKQSAALQVTEGRLREAEELIEAVEGEREAAVREAEQLRAELEKVQSAYLERRHRAGGGDENNSSTEPYLDELTRNYMDHAKLQFVYKQLQERSERESQVAASKLESMTARVQDLEDDKEEAADRMRVLHAYLWRLLGVAALVRHGHVSEAPSSDTPVRDAQVTAGVATLTNFVTAKLAEGTPSGAPAAAHGGGPEERRIAELQGMITSLKEQLVRKDAQREVILDAKLKRIQDLALKLHSMNAALTREMTICFNDNDQLFRLIDDHPKLSQRASKSELFPRSLQAALERAKFAPVPGKPYGHN